MRISSSLLSFGVSDHYRVLNTHRVETAHGTRCDSNIPERHLGPKSRTGTELGTGYAHFFSTSIPDPSSASTEIPILQSSSFTPRSVVYTIAVVARPVNQVHLMAPSTAIPSNFHRAPV